MQLLRHRHQPSIRSKLITLVIACALPILAGYFAFARDADRRERQHVAQDALTVTRALAAAVERDLASGESAALVLASSRSLASGDLAEFHARARRLLRPDSPAYGYELSGPDGTPLLDTRYAFGTRLRPDGNERAVRRVFASGDAVTSGLHRAADGQPWVVSIEVPVWRDGKVAYALSVQLRPRRLAELLDEQNLPPHWYAEVFDSQGELVARSGGQPEATGARIHPALAAAVARADSGIADLKAAGAGHWRAAFARTPGRGWTVSVVFPRDAAREMLGHSQGAVLLGALALLAVSLALAWRIGGSIARAVRALTAPAAALGRGEPLALPDLRLREAAAVADALRQVEGELVGYRTRLEALVAERTAELVRSNALLESVYASAPVGLAFVDSELRFVMVNDYLATLNGIPAGAHTGHTLPELLGAPGVELEADYRRVLASGRPLVEAERSTDDPATPGGTRHWLVSYYPVYGADRALAGINAVVLDITERKLKEQRDRDNEELFRALYEGSGDANMLVAAGAGFVSANPAAAALFGCASVEEFLTLSPASASPAFQPDGRRSDLAAAEHIQRALDTGGDHFEWLHQRRDGSTFYADVVLTSVNIGGRGIVQALVRDISARVATEEALREAGRRLQERELFIRTVTDHLPALVGYWDADLRCQFANRPYLDWLGRPEHEVIGHSAAELLPEAHRRAADHHVRGVFAGVAQGFERTLEGPSGAALHTWSSYIPDFGEDGKVRGFYMLLTDVTELKRTGDRLGQALREAEQANRAKGEFLANMSHEIRTPMNAIMGLARLLEEAALGRRERSYVERMKTAARSLLGMLNDLLDFSRIEAGQLALEHMPFAIDEVLESILVLAAANAWDKGIEPVFAVAPDVPPLLVGDRIRLGQVLLNLVGNAIKFTDQGEVVLAIRVLRRDPGRVQLEFSVRDTGIGIAPDQQERMFEAFSQGDSSTGRKYGGAGLGLAISRRLAQLMGGTLRVDSALGRGAAFAFDASFPVADAVADAVTDAVADAVAGAVTDAVADAQPDAQPAAPVEPGGLAVLVADDNASALAALADACAALGMQVDRAACGGAALDLLRTRSYALALVDAAMPDLDGVAVLACAHEDGVALPPFAVLAPERERERLTARFAPFGSGTVLAKPVTPAALRAAVAELLHGPAPAPAARSVPLAARLQGLRVLLVEDNLINQEVAKYILVHAGAAVDIAANGRAAVDMLAAGSAYDVVLMDLQMPVMNGYEASKAIRAMGLRLPILAMTANAMEEDRRRALAAGMDAHLAKPIDVDELLSLIERVAGVAARPVAALPAPATAAPAGAPAQVAGIDLPAALARFGGDFGAFAAVFGRLESSEGATLGEVREQLARGEHGRARQMLHRLRGVAANLGATEVAALALECERALANQPDQVLDRLLARLDAALQRVLQASRALERQGPAPASGAHATTAARNDLLRLLELLEANNMGAIERFEALGPALAAMLAPQDAAALADAVESLRFDAAAALVRSLLERKEQA